MNTCVVCGARYPRGQTCPRCHPGGIQPAAAAGPRFNVIKWLLVAAMLGVVGLLGIWAVVLAKNLGKAGHDYGQALVDAQHSSSDAACALQLRSIHQSLQVAATAEDGRFPAALTELYSASQLRCPSRDGPAYIYIPGQTASMAGGNVLVYEDRPVHEGKCSVLRLNGKVELLTPEQVQAEVAKTRRVIAAAKRPGG